MECRTWSGRNSEKTKLTKTYKEKEIFGSRDRPRPYVTRNGEEPSDIYEKSSTFHNSTVLSFQVFIFPSPSYEHNINFNPRLTNTIKILIIVLRT